MTGRIGNPVALLCCWAVALSFAGIAQAQQVPQRPAAPLPVVGQPSPPAAAPAAPRQAGPGAADVAPVILEVPLNQSKFYNLPVSVESLVVGDENIADVRYDRDRPNQLLVIAGSIGSTNVHFLDGAGNVVHRLEVRVVTDYQVIKSALAELLPDEAIDISVYRDSIFLTGKVRSAESMASAVSIVQRFAADPANVINMLSLQGSQQVILQVRVAEMTRTVRKDLTTGVNVSQGWGVGNLNPGNLITFSTDQAATANTRFATGFLDSQISGLGQVQFDILERQGLVKTLAEPTLMAVSGEPASFLVGGTTPIPSGVSSDGSALCCDNIEFGIGLDFVPVVIDKGRISLNITTTISELGAVVDIGGVDAYNIIEKRASTTVELPSGGSVMIAGLLKDNMGDTIRGFPFLMDIPILGALVRSSEFTRDETELVITVTVYLAKPTGDDAPLALPTDGFEPASDIDIYLLGRLHREYTKKELPIWAKPLKGPFGYIME